MSKSCEEEVATILSELETTIENIDKVCKLLKFCKDSIGLYEVERIVRIVTRRPTLTFLVEWTGFKDPMFHSLATIDDFQDRAYAEELVTDFEKKLKRKYRNKWRRIPKSATWSLTKKKGKKH